MKKIFTLLLCSLSLATASKLYAQTSSSFTVQHDTVSVSISGSTNVEDGIINLSSGSLTVNWKVIYSNFPADWVAVTGFCDNVNCYSMSGLWPGGISHGTAGIATGSTPSDFHMQIDLSSVATPTGCYYVTVRMNNQFTPTDTALATFKICRTIPTSVPTVKPVDEVTIYPNPASNELNVVYEAEADIKNIAVYNIIGKLMTVYRVTNSNSANLNLENIPSGIYFVRLINSHGAVAATKKFTKQ